MKSWLFVVTALGAFAGCATAGQRVAGAVVGTSIGTGAVAVGTVSVVAGAINSATIGDLSTKTPAAQRALKPAADAAGVQMVVGGTVLAAGLVTGIVSSMLLARTIDDAAAEAAKTSRQIGRRAVDAPRVVTPPAAPAQRQPVDDGEGQPSRVIEPPT